MVSQHHYRGFGTGAVRRERDARDFRLEHFPGVCAQVAAGVPDSWDLSPKAAQIYSQGAIPCCVLASIAQMKGIEDAIDRGAWSSYEYLEAYHAVGGNDREGVPARAALQYAQDTGLRVSGGDSRRRIASYAFAPQDPTGFVATLKAALADNRPCVLACRLPERFGWDSDGPATEGYHQLCLCGYDRDWAIGPNSWGRDWGRGGFYRLRWDYLTANGLQGGDCYAYTAFDRVDNGPVPAP